MVEDVKVVVTEAEDAMVVKEEAMAVAEDVTAETVAVAVSEISLEEAVKIEVEVADAMAETIENADLN